MKYRLRLFLSLSVGFALVALNQQAAFASNQELFETLDELLFEEVDETTEVAETSEATETAALPEAALPEANRIEPDFTEGDSPSPSLSQGSGSFVERPF